MATTVENIVTPEGLLRVPRDVWIVSRRVEEACILRRDTAAEAFPRVAIGERCIICFHQNQLETGVYASRIWCGRGAHKFYSDHHMISIGREIACLKGIGYLSDTAGSAWIN